jgi:hypothetical protein
VSDKTNVPRHKPWQQANAARVTPANSDPHRANDDGQHNDKVAPNQFRYEATASAVPGAGKAHAARIANPAHRRIQPIDRAWPFNPEYTPLLAWWRTLPPDRLRYAEAIQIGTTPDKLDTMRSGTALAASLRGEVAAGVAVALSLISTGEVTLEVSRILPASNSGADSDAENASENEA